MSSKKLSAWVAAGVVIIIAMVIVTLQNQTKDKMPSTKESSPVVTRNPIAPPKEKTPELHAVTYTDSGFSPATINIAQGEIITFVNKSSGKMWPASGAHPTHNLYPTKGGCIGSTFDACQGIPGNTSWSFQFEVPGSWKYHNHLSPGKTGTIVVTP